MWRKNGNTKLIFIQNDFFIIYKFIIFYTNNVPCRRHDSINHSQSGAPTFSINFSLPLSYIYLSNQWDWKEAECT